MENGNRDWGMLDEPFLYEPGEICFHDWEIVRRIGTGANGSVYELKKSLFGMTQVSAMKVIRVTPDPGMDGLLRSMGQDEAAIRTNHEDMLRGVIREIQTMIALADHPNVVRCEDYAVYQILGTETWEIQIRMELLESLEARLIRTHAPMDEAEAIRVGCDVLAALSMCEEQGVLHRDVKPANIFVDKLGNYKLGDFGSARRDNGTAMTQKAGTELYMAPEVMQGNHYDCRADLYSLGLVLYQLVNGNRLPFYPEPGRITRQTMEDAWVRRMRGEEMPPPESASPALYEILRKACAFAPADRFTSAREMRSALIALRQGAPTITPRLEKKKTPAKPRKTTEPEVKNESAREQPEPRKPKTVEGPQEAAPGKPAKKLTMAQKTEEWLKAAEQGDAEAGFRLGEYYERSRGSDHMAKAAEYYRNAASLGHAEAQRALGDFLSQGKGGLDRDPAAAAKWYQKAAEQGSAAAMHALALCYFHGGSKAMRKNEKLSLDWLTKAAAEYHYGPSQNLLGRFYECGECRLNKNLKEALGWYRKAAQQDDPDGLYNCGRMLEEGLGTEKNPSEAFGFYERAADLKQVDAQYRLAQCYAQGTGTVRDEQKAVAWYEQAAKHGHLEAQYELAYSCDTGRGCPVDAEKALRWYQKAGNQGHAEACYRAGLCYRHVKKDEKSAFQWFRRAAEKDNPQAMYLVGLCYYNGLGAPKDKKQAHQWLKKAADQGDKNSVEFLKKHVKLGILW